MWGQGVSVYEKKRKKRAARVRFEPGSPRECVRARGAASPLSTNCFVTKRAAQLTYTYANYYGSPELARGGGDATGC